MLLVPFVDSGELETNFINEVLFVGGGELSIIIHVGFSQNLWLCR